MAFQDQIAVVISIIPIGAAAAAAAAAAAIVQLLLLR
jgi:hypothetical protein